MTFPTPDNPPVGNENTKPDDNQLDTDTQDAGMYEAGIPGAVERRLIHVDRVTEETLVLVRAQNQQTLAIVAMIAIVGAMVYLVHRDLAGLELA